MSKDHTDNVTSRKQRYSYLQDTIYRTPLVIRKSHLSVVGQRLGEGGREAEREEDGGRRRRR